jgi:hypothetical protein
VQITAGHGYSLSGSTRKSCVHAMQYDSQIKRGSQRDPRLTIKGTEPLKK